MSALLEAWIVVGPSDELVVNRVFASAEAAGAACQRGERPQLFVAVCRRTDHDGQPHRFVRAKDTTC